MIFFVKQVEQKKKTKTKKDETSNESKDKEKKNKKRVVVILSSSSESYQSDTECEAETEVRILIFFLNDRVLVHVFFLFEIVLRWFWKFVWVVNHLIKICHIDLISFENRSSHLNIERIAILGLHNIGGLLNIPWDYQIFFSH